LSDTWRITEDIVQRCNFGWSLLSKPAIHKRHEAFAKGHGAPYFPTTNFGGKRIVGNNKQDSISLKNQLVEAPAPIFSRGDIISVEICFVTHFQQNSQKLIYVSRVSPRIRDENTWTQIDVWAPWQLHFASPQIVSPPDEIV
jgi:hypothetical protein